MCVPVVEVLGYDEVFEVVVYRSLIILEKRVGVAQTVAGLGLHGSVLQLPRQLQCPPDKHADMLVQNTAERPQCLPVASYMTQAYFPRGSTVWEQVVFKMLVEDRKTKALFMLGGARLLKMVFQQR